jgi:hypothetical protein
MLDECKGDKFFEVLMLFSTLVLRRRLAHRERQTIPLNPARYLATAKKIQPEEHRLLLPLVIAHRVVLESALKRKTAAKARYQKLSRTLHEKSKEIAERKESLATSLEKSCMDHSVTDRQERLLNNLKTNWVGSNKWMGALLNGGESHQKDLLLNRSFSDVWTSMEKGDLLEGDDTAEGLFDVLDSRIKQHQVRLQKWQKFQHKFHVQNNSHQAKSVLSIERKTLPSLKLVEHEKIQLKHSRTRDNIESEMMRGTGSVYEDIIADMDAQLQQVGAFPKRQIDAVACELAIKSTLPPQISRKSIKPASLLLSRTAINTDGKLVVETHDPMQIQKDETSDSGCDNSQMELKSIQLHNPLHLEQPSPSPQRPEREETHAFERSPPREKPSLADEIISSVAEAEPSPIKKPYISLTERTRMSMAFARGSEIFSPEESLPPKTSSPEPLLEQEQPINRRMSLLERTRQSMSNMAAVPRPKPRKSASVKSRQSLYPVNQFETPNKKPAIQEEETDESNKVPTPKELLFSENAEYDSVFKSRPKVANSPVITPVVDSMVQAEERESDVEDIWEVSSPLKRFGRRTTESLS